VRLAAVDIGTNTVRYLVADVSDSDLTDVDRGREITRLGQGVDAQRRLHPDAVARTLDAIERSVDAARAAGAQHVRVAGTSALRDATDRDAFVHAVAERTGEALEILPGAEEGRLSMLGATAGLPPQGTYVVCDIGGGSTELTTAASTVSLDIGSVRLKERFLHTDPPRTDEVAAAAAAVDEALEEAGSLSLGGHETLVGVAGTITSLAALAAGLGDYDRDVVHGSVIDRATVVEWTGRLLAMTAAQVRELGPVEAGRADVLAGGALILERVMLRFVFDEVLVSERDILDGLVLDAARADERNR
jgi:exopolyphosphatase/guanosine-5'-triphosphate,3'-diphosphate pyrophosphatase